MCLNAKNRVVAVHRCHVGGLNVSLVIPREVFKSAILNNSASIIVSHQHPMIVLLYFDFLEQVKKGAKYEQLCSFLISNKKKYIERPLIQKRVIKQITPNLLAFEQKEEGMEVTSEEKRAEITLRIKESEIYRGEIFLHDISPFLMDEELTVENLTVILFMDFLQRVKEKGNSTQVMKSILLNLRIIFKVITIRK